MLGDGGDVRTLVPVDVAQSVALQTLGIILLDKVLGELPRTIVFEPIERISCP